MGRIEENIQKEKVRYLKFCEENKEKKIYIYGAGRMAKPLYLFLKENKVSFSFFPLLFCLFFQILIL